MGNLVTLPPPALLSPPAPAPSEAPAEEGLSGGAPTTSAPSAPAPVTAPPAPHENVARHILSALGGGDGPMGWAKSVIAGSLAGAANVGKVPEGGGFLAGAAKGAQGVQELQRQKQLDAQKVQQQQFENQEKQKADARQEQELQIHMQDATVQRAMWNAQTAASVQTQQQNALRFPTLQKEDQLRAKQLSEQIQQSENDQLSVLSAAGVDIAKLEHVTSYDQLTEDHAKQAGSGGIFAVPNGEAHSDGEDKAGAYIVPGDVWDRPITKPISITTGYDVDPKTGKATPKTITAQEGTKVGTLLAIAKGAQTDLANKQGQIIQQANIAEKRANVQKDFAEAGKASAEAKKTELEAGQLQSLNPTGAEGLSGEAYLKTLPGPTQQLFQSVAEGRNKEFQIQNRKGELTPAGQAFIRAYPDYDVAKAHEYPKLVTEFTTGQTGKSIVAMGTAINHARAAYDNTGAASFIPGTAENKRYKQDVTFVSEELGKYLKGGVATEGEVHEIQDGLKSSVPWLRKAALENAAHIIDGRRSELEQQWKNGQVRPSYQPPMPNMSPQAQANADYMRSGGKSGNTAVQSFHKPEGATMKVPGSDGKIHWSDGKTDLGIAP